MTTKAIEAGARAVAEVRGAIWKPNKPVSANYDHDVAKACIEAAIASGERVPASAVAAERERCAAVPDKAMIEFTSLLEYQAVSNSQNASECATLCAKAAREIADKIRALPETASGEFVVVPRKLTPDMIVQGYEHVNRDLCEGKGDALDRLWSAMLNAASRNGDGK